jgi:hypothetical protein
MAFHYTTEYRLGRRGRVSRTYGGLQALIAITFDLALALVFGLIGLGMQAARRCLVAAYRVARWCVMTAYRVVVALLGLPLRAIRGLSFASSARTVAKPAWAGLDEL